MKPIFLAGAVLAVLSWPTLANAKTTVSVSGTTATITVPIDVGDIAGAMVTDPDTGKRMTAAEYWESGTERIWNGGFVRFRYHDCVTFKLDLQIYAAKQSYNHGFKVDGTTGHHHIAINPYIDRPYVWDPAAKNANEDSTTAYTTDLEGVWTQQHSNVTSHEVGHLLGLGDDYTMSPDGKFSVLPGRENTIMAASNPPALDQNIVDRVGKLIEKAGIKLPQCWTGTIESDTSRTYLEGIYGGNTHCTDHWHATLAFGVDTEGKLEGHGEARLTKTPSCYAGVVKLARLETFTVQGRASDQELMLQLAFESGDGVVMAGWSANVIPYNGGLRPAPPGPPLPVPRTDPCTAKGTVTVHDRIPSGGKIDPLTAVDRIELKCPQPGAT